MTDQEQIDEAAEDLEDATEDVSRGLRWYAKIYLTVLFLGIVAAIGGAVYFGYINPNITVTATVEVGYLLEYVAMGLTGAFLLWTAAMILVALPGSFTANVVKATARVADNYELPTEDNE